MSYAILYDQAATDFNSMGLGPLSAAETTTVTEVRNGEFYLDLTYPIDAPRAQLLKEGNIIKADAGHKLKGQLFDITTVTASLTTITVHAEHISYRLSRMAMTPQWEATGSAASVLQDWRNAIIGDKDDVVVDSDLSNDGQVVLDISKASNARQALGGVDGSILDVFGGEYRFDNLHVSLLAHRGSAINTLLAYGRNITDFSQERAIDQTYTSIMPYATYTPSATTTTDDSKDTSDDASTETPTAQIVTIPGYYVDSDNASHYAHRRILPVDFTEKFTASTGTSSSSTDDKKPDTATLTQLAKDYCKDNNIGVPTVTTTISFVDLSKSANYADVAPLEQVDLCDEIPVWFSKLDINSTAKVSSVVWNVLSDSYDSLTLGDLQASLADNIATIAQTTATGVANNAVVSLIGANGINSNFYVNGLSFDEFPPGKKVGDILFDTNGDSKTMYIWDGAEWVRTISTDDVDAVKKQVDAQQDDIKQAETDAQTAVDTANAAVAASDLTKQTADAANQAATDAAAVGKTAKDLALKAQADAVAAADNATKAMSSAQSAVDTIGDTQADIKTVSQKIDDAAGTIKTLASKTDLDGVKGTATAAQTLAQQNADELKLKADSTDVDTLNGTVTNLSTQVTANSSGLSTKIERTDVQGMLKDYATQDYTDTQISAKAGELSANISNVTSKIDNLQIGGRNLLLDTKTMASWTVDGNPLDAKLEPVDIGNVSGAIRQHLSGDAAWGDFFAPPVKLVKGEQYTYSAFIWSETAGNQDALMYYSPGNNEQGDSYGGAVLLNSITALPQRVSATFVSAVDGPAVIRIETGSYKDIGGLYVALEKLEQGNKATDWSPAPEDLETYTDSQISDLKLTVDGLTQTTATKTDVQTLTNQLATTSGGLTNLTTKVTDQGTQITSLKTSTDAFAVTMDDFKNNATTQIQTLQGFQNTASSDITGIKSQQTQLSNQITSIVGGLGQTNLVYNSELKTDTDGWEGAGLAVGHNQWDMANGSNSLAISDTTSAVGTWNVVKSKQVSVEQGAPYSASGILYVTEQADPAATSVLFNIDFWDDSGKRTSFKSADFDVTKAHDKQTLTITDVVPDTAAKYVTVSVWLNGQLNLMLNHPMLVADATVGPYQPDNVSQSQITQLQDSIDLRVQKGDLLSQINIQAGQTLIQSGKLYLDAPTVAFSGAAFIPSAAITSLSADKITAGTLNAANINVLNLNGQSIVSGTVTADKLAANSILVGLNEGLQSLEIRPDGMHTTDSSGSDVGFVHTNSLVKFPQYYGLQFDLDAAGDYMGWAAQSRNNPNSLYALKLSWCRSEIAGTIGQPAGFAFGDDVTFQNSINVPTAYQKLAFYSVKYNNVNYPALMNQDGKVGIMFGSGALYLVDSTGVTTLNSLRK